LFKYNAIPLNKKYYNYIIVATGFRNKLINAYINPFPRNYTHINCSDRIKYNQHVIQDISLHVLGEKKPIRSTTLK